MPPFLFGSLGEYQSAFGKKALIEESLVGPGVLQPSVYIEIWGFSKANHDRYACSDVLILLLGASYFLASTQCCLHVYKALSPAQSLLAFSANCLPSEATSTSSGRIFDQGPPPEYLQTLCHTYHCHVTLVGHYKYSSAVNITHLP